jgi:RecA-family ATPase
MSQSPFAPGLGADFIDDEMEEAARSNGRASSGGDITAIDPTTLHGLPVPARQWLVPNWAPMARVTGLYGTGGEGKTCLAQQLATASAIGAQWLGLPVRQCNSLLVYCEDDLDEMFRRQDEINRHYGCTFADLSPMRWLPRLGADNALMTFGTGRALLTDFFGEVRRIALEYEARLVVIDTLADVFGGNENDRGQARAFAQAALGYLARETGGAMIALAHPSRAGMNSESGESGSTAWVGTFRSQLYLASPKPGEGEPLAACRTGV